MTSVNHFVVTIELSQTYLDTALLKALKLTALKLTAK